MYKKPKKSPENPGYAELDKNRLQGRNDGTYQKLVKRDSDYVIPAHERRGRETPGQNKMYKKPKKSPENPGYAELDKNRLQGRNDGTYQKLVKRDSDYVIPAHERRESYEDIKMGRNLPDYEELDLSKREVDDYQKLMKT
jgi:hypothetical protein